MEQAGGELVTTRRLRSLAVVMVVIDIVLLVLAALLGMHFESTPRALADAEKAQALAVPAALGLATAAAASWGARRRWAGSLLALSVVLSVVALGLYLTL